VERTRNLISGLPVTLGVVAAGPVVVAVVEPAIVVVEPAIVVVVKPAGATSSSSTAAVPVLPLRAGIAQLEGIASGERVQDGGCLGRGLELDKAVVKGLSSDAVAD
jgi:hypothetical protein